MDLDKINELYYQNKSKLLNENPEQQGDEKPVSWEDIGQMGSYKLGKAQGMLFHLKRKLELREETPGAFSLQELLDDLDQVDKLLGDISVRDT